MLEHIALGIFEIDHEDVGHRILDRPAHLVDVMNDGHAGMPRFAQPIFDDGGANAVFIDDKYRQFCFVHLSRSNASA